MILLMMTSDDTNQRLLELDVAGSPFVEHLPAQLRATKWEAGGGKREAGRGKRETGSGRREPKADDGYDLRVIHGGTVRGSGMAADDSANTDSEMLAVQTDVWFTDRALAALLTTAVTEQRPLKVFSARAVLANRAPNRELLAVYLPKATTSKLFRNVDDLTQLGTIDQLAARIKGARELQGPDLDSERGPTRVRTLLDVSVAETHILYARALEALASGVRIRDPRSIAIRGELRCGEDVEIDLHVIIEGTVTLGSGVTVGANCILKSASVGARTKINPYSIVENAEIGSNSMVGPYARVRPGSVIGDAVQIGNFVEVKNSNIGSGSRINHLAFVGDASLGKNVTIGAGTITCNHDRRGVARTEIGEGAYIGSGCLLVAPLSIGAHATIGAGSTITKEAPEGKLTIARSRQVTIENWTPPRAAEQ
jgi:UDP-3-O-[3-hydroxymyristoyl] glucosamine N-acyltransferase